MTGFHRGGGSSFSVSSQSKPKAGWAETNSRWRCGRPAVLVWHLPSGHLRSGSARRCFPRLLSGSPWTPHRSGGVLRQKLSPPGRRGRRGRASRSKTCAFVSFKKAVQFCRRQPVRKLSQTAAALGGTASVGFARDFSFRQLKSGNMILLGTRQSNPWIQSFDSHLTLRWKFDPALDGYYQWNISASPSEADTFRSGANSFKTHEGYASVAFLPNPGGTGNVLIISGTGGAAVSTAVNTHLWYFATSRASMSHTSLRPSSGSRCARFAFSIITDLGASVASSSPAMSPTHTKELGAAEAS
jgi:hypothetical protein